MANGMKAPYTLLFGLVGRNSSLGVRHLGLIVSDLNAFSVSSTLSLIFFGDFRKSDAHGYS